MSGSVSIDRVDLLETLRDIRAANEAGDTRTVDSCCQALIDDYQLAYTREDEARAYDEGLHHLSKHIARSIGGIDG